MKKRWFGLVAVALAWVVVLVALLGAADVVAAGPAPAASPAQAPTVDEVAPSSAPNDLDTTIVITGSGFVAVPTVTLSSTLLEEVGWVSAERLTATVPWGLEPGVYALTVENPGGGTGSLSDAFTVTQGIGVWTTGGPYGGRVEEVVLHPLTSTTVYATVFQVGVFASFDSAASWELTLANSWPIGLRFDAQDPDVIYCASDNGLPRTLDGGLTWELLPELFHSANGCYTSYPAPHPTAAGVVYAGTGRCAGIPIVPGEGGIYYSDDYGDTWLTRTVGLTDTDIIDIAFHPDDPATMAAATFSGNVFTTTNGGLTWQWAADLGKQLRRIYFSPSGSHEAWIVPHLEYQPPELVHLYKSSDPGLSTWVSTVLTTQLSTSGGIWSLTFVSDTIWAAGDSGYVSDDGGATWSRVIGGEDPVGEVKSFALPSDDEQTIYAGTEMNGVVVSTDDGATWQEQNEGLAGLQVRGLAVPRGEIDTIYANTFERGILRSDDGGQAWLELAFFHGGSPKGQVLAADPFATERVYFADSCEDLPCMRVSADRGATWQEVTMTLPITWAGWMGRTLVAAPHPAVPGRLLAGVGFCYDTAHCNSGDEPSGLYASDDYGQNWSFLGPSPAISEVLSIAYDTADPDLIYAGTGGMGLWRSTDGGDTWTPAPIPGVLPPVHIESIAPHPDIANTVYVRLYSYAGGPNPQPNLFVSDDAGLTWQELPDVDTVFGGGGGVGLVFTPPAPDSAPYSLHTGCDPGLCRSLDGGYTWEEVDGAPRPDVGTVLVANSDGERSRLYVGTSGGIASAVGAAAPRDTIPGRGSLMGGGVYRMTLTPLGGYEVYLPLVLKGHSP
jgi:photosystem II stability/assembly factor-like uncharacterized protein